MGTKNGWNIPELLAPAGGFEQLKAAVENGADAVYLGGKLFNARMGAGNFGAEEWEEAIAYAHLRGVQIHVALNTLLTDRELPMALEEAIRLYEAGADAFIVQDLGFAKILHQNFPEIPLHLSTQGTVCNAEGARAAAALGFSRVVLARETTVSEMREIVEQVGPLEIEVFVHGALCVCYSGQCQLSRQIGGRSGNRGVCAQPCRLPYRMYAEEQSEEAVGIQGYPLSPKDLCSLEQLPALCRSGVDSLKIEGRMKSAEYVAAVTSIYRKYLNLCEKLGPEQADSIKAEPEDLRVLRQMFSRGPFTSGYLNGNPGRGLMSGSMAKHQGLPIGTVKRIGPGKTQITIRLTEPLSIGDGIEIHAAQSGEGRLPGNVVTYLRPESGGTNVDRMEAGSMAIAGDIDCGGVKVLPGDPVYRISEKTLLQTLRSSFENRSGEAEKEGRKTPVTFFFQAGLNRETTLTAYLGSVSGEDDANAADPARFVSETGKLAEPARTRPVTEETVRAQLAKTGGTPFRMAECRVELEEGISISASELNALRRTVLAGLEQKCQGRRNPFPPQRLEAAKREAAKREGGEQRFEGGESSLYLFRTDHTFYDQLEEGRCAEGAFDRYWIPYTDFLDPDTAERIETLRSIGMPQGGLQLIPALPQVTQGEHDRLIRKNWDKLLCVAKAAGGISVGNLGWLEPFLKEGISVFGDFGLNLYSSSDLAFAEGLGLKGAAISHELTLEQVGGLEFCGLEIEFAAGGTMPVMISRHDFAGDAGLKEAVLKDRKGVFFPVLSDPISGNGTIFYRKEISGRNLMLSQAKKMGVNLRFYGFR